MSTQPITVVIKCVIQTEKINSAKAALKANIKIVMAQEPACHGIWVYDDPQNPEQLLIVEYWDSQEVFSGPHMQTPHMQRFLREANGFLAGAAEFTFWREIIAEG